MTNIKFKRNLGTRIRKAREGADISQLQLAEQLYLKPVTINNYERGYRLPDVETLNRIADITDCSITYLMRGTEIDDPLPKRTYISKSDAIHLLKRLGKEDRSDDFKSDIEDIIHCIDDEDDWGKPKAVTTV